MADYQLYSYGQHFELRYRGQLIEKTDGQPTKLLEEWLGPKSEWLYRPGIKTKDCDIYNLEQK